VSLPQRAREAFFDTHPVTGATIEVFYADRSLESSAGMVPVGSGAGGSAGTQLMRRPWVRLRRATLPIGTLF
jgi:hypothetical protein